MFFIYIDGKPYYYDKTIGKVYGVVLTSMNLTVDFKNGAKAPKEIDCIYTLEEIRAKCGLYTVEVFNKTTKKTTKTSSGTVSSVVPTTTVKPVETEVKTKTVNVKKDINE